MLASMQRRSFLIAAAAATARPARAAVQEDLVWTDAARTRDIPLRVRWPDGSAPCALVLHSHGLGGNREGGDVWGEAWRAAGLAVVHLQHPGSGTEVFRTGGARALRGAASAQQLVARVADVRFVLDDMLRRAQAREGPWARVRADAIGLSGHSFGAVTVQTLAGARYAVRTPDVTDARLRAFVALSPSPDRQERLSLREQFGAITRPFLAVTGSHDGDPLAGRGGGELTPQHRAGVYDGLPPGQRALLWLEGADHMTFGGNGKQRLTARRGPLRRESAAIDNESAHHERVARVTTLWWQAHLLGDANAAAALRAPAGLGAGDRWRMD
jgi:hypothetical protein